MGFITASRVNAAYITPSGMATGRQAGIRPTLTSAYVQNLQAHMARNTFDQQSPSSPCKVTFSDDARAPTAAATAPATHAHSSHDLCRPFRMVLGTGVDTGNL
jgi:hypothetical protein